MFRIFCKRRSPKRHRLSHFDHLFVMFVRHPGDSNKVFFSCTSLQTCYDRDVK